MRQKFLRDLTIRGKAEYTQQVYTACVADLASYYNRSPDLLTYDQVADWLFHLRNDAAASIARMQIRVEGKGANKRVLPMNPHLLHVLGEYWLAERKGRPGHGSLWLFLGEDQQSPIRGATGRNIYYRALKKSGVPPKGGIHVLRHSFANHLIESGVELTLVPRPPRSY